MFTAAIMSFTSFLDQMPQKLKTEFNEEFKNEYMRRKVIFKRRQNNEEQTVILDMYRVLIIYAQKWKSYMYKSISAWKDANLHFENLYKVIITVLIYD